MRLTKYVVGANANPPKNPRRPPKKGKVMATNIVNAEMTENLMRIKPNPRMLPCFGTQSLMRRGFYLPTYILREINRRVIVGLKCSFFTNTDSIMSNTGIAYICINTIKAKS